VKTRYFQPAWSCDSFQEITFSPFFSRETKPGFEGESHESETELWRMNFVQQETHTHNSVITFIHFYHINSKHTHPSIPGEVW